VEIIETIDIPEHDVGRPERQITRRSTPEATSATSCFRSPGYTISRSPQRTRGSQVRASLASGFTVRPLARLTERNLLAFP